MKRSIRDALALIEEEAVRLKKLGREIGTVGQTQAIAKLPSLRAAYVAVQCYKTRLSRSLSMNLDTDGDPVASTPRDHFDGAPDDFLACLRSLAATDNQSGWVRLDPRELAMVKAALRYWQGSQIGRGRDSIVAEIEIDALVQRLSTVQDAAAERKGDMK